MHLILSLLGSTNVDVAYSSQTLRGACGVIEMLRTELQIPFCLEFRTLLIFRTVTITKVVIDIFTSFKCGGLEF